MEKENVKKRANVYELLDQIGQEANKIRKVSKSVNFYAKQAAKQGANVEDITKNTTQEIREKLKKDGDVDGSFPESQSRTSLDGLLDGLTNVELDEKIESLLRETMTESKKEEESSPSTSGNRLYPITTDIRSPSLPLADPLGDYDETAEPADDEASDSDSEFCPDWSSVGSLASSVTNYEEADVSSDDDIINSVTPGGYVRLNDDLFADDDVLQLSDDEDEEEKIFSQKNSHIRHYDVIKKVLGSKQPEYDNVVALPAPAAGNEKEDSEKSQTSNSEESTNKFKPQVIRRVKSMIYEVAKDKEMDAEQRKRVLMKKRAHDVNPSLASITPSPLLSAEDAGSLKQSPSQVSVKFSLKRSNSNITMTSHVKHRHLLYGRDVIHEESDDDLDNVSVNSDALTL